MCPRLARTRRRAPSERSSAPIFTRPWPSRALLRARGCRDRTLGRWPACPPSTSEATEEEGAVRLARNQANSRRRARGSFCSRSSSWPWRLRRAGVARSAPAAARIPHRLGPGLVDRRPGRDEPRLPRRFGDPAGRNIPRSRGGTLGRRADGALAAASLAMGSHFMSVAFALGLVRGARGRGGSSARARGVARSRATRSAEPRRSAARGLLPQRLSSALSAPPSRRSRFSPRPALAGIDATVVLLGSRPARQSTLTRCAGGPGENSGRSGSSFP